MNKIELVQYDKNWKADFQKIKEELLTVLKYLIIDIEHIGSTSVEGLSSKPCIDIDVIIKDYEVFENIKIALEKIGYIYEGDLGLKDRIAFTYIDKPHLKKHHLYVCPIFSKELKRHLALRDTLRKNPELKEKYQKVKEQAAILFPYDINKYIEYKSQIIKEIYIECGLE